MGRLAPQALSFLVQVALFRIAGLEVVGQFAILTAIGNLTFGTLGAGIRTNLLREADPSLSGSAFLLLSWFSPFALLIAVGVTWWTGISFGAGVAALAGVFFIGLGELLGIHYRITSRDHKILLPRILPPALFLFFIIMERPLNTKFVSLFYFFSYATIPIFVLFENTLKIFNRENLSYLKNVWKGSTFVSGSTIFTQIYGNVDLVLIKTFLSDNLAGIYKIAFSFSNLAMPTIGVFAFIYASKLKNAIITTSKRNVRSFFSRQILINFCVGVTYYIVMGILTYIFIPIIYGTKAVSAIPIIFILNVGVVLNMICMVFSYTMLAFSLEKNVFMVSFVAAITNLIFNVAFIPRFNAIGAATASVATQFSILIIFFYLVKKSDLFAED